MQCAWRVRVAHGACACACACACICANPREPPHTVLSRRRSDAEFSLAHPPPHRYTASKAYGASTVPTHPRMRQLHAARKAERAHMWHQAADRDQQRLCLHSERPPTAMLVCVRHWPLSQRPLPPWLPHRSHCTQQKQLLAHAATLRSPARHRCLHPLQPPRPGFSRCPFLHPHMRPGDSG